MALKKVVVDKANRIYQLAPDLFSFTRDKTRRGLIKKTELIDIGKFNWPVLPEDSATGKGSQTPASQEKIDQLKEALIDWFATHHKAKIVSPKEIYIGGRISTLVFSIALAFIDNGDIVFVPELGLPLYRRVTMACGGEAIGYGVSGKNNWMPEFERISTRLGRVARLLFLNSPHNPTGATLNQRDLENLVWMASRENITLVNDAAYQSISERTPASLMSIEGARHVGVEVYSFSYLLGLPPIPFGFVVGNRDVISGLNEASALMPQYIPQHFVETALEAIRNYPVAALGQCRKQFDQSAAEATKLLELLSLEKSGYDTTPFIWARIERRRHALTLANLLYRRSRVLAAPGTAFGENGEGYLRFSLTASAATYREACDRIGSKIRLFRPTTEEA
jgi:aspartate/methionine/tyrosine aminotransferase